MNKAEFRQIVPEDGGSLILYKYIQGAFGVYGYEIQSVSIHRNSCSQQDISEIGTDIRKLTLTINTASYTALVSDQFNYPEYINYDIQPFNVTSYHQPGDPAFPNITRNCTIGVSEYSQAAPFKLDGQVPVSDQEVGYYGGESGSVKVRFKNSDFNVLLNNTEKNRTRKGVYIVERGTKDITPSNLSAINDGYAQKAEILELNYSSTGLKNSRYDGAKTTKAEYGILPAISATEFEGAVYTNIPSGSTQQQDIFICSQSIEARHYKTLVFSINKQATSVTQGDGITDSILPRIRTTRIFFSGSKVGDTDGFSAPSASQTDFAVSSLLDIEQGDILAFSYFSGPGQTTSYENVLVNSVEYISESLNGPIIGTSGSVQRGYLSDIDSVSILDETTNWAGSSVFSIHKYTPDIVYEVNGNVPNRIINKRLYLKETGEVFYVDEKGQVLAKTIDC